MVNADIVFRKLHNNEIDDVPIEEGNVIYDLDTKQIFVDDVVDGVLKRVRYGGSEKLIKTIISANTTTKTIYDDTITTDSIIRVYVDEHDSFTYNSISTASGSVTITFNAMTQDVPIQIGIGAVSEFHQLITEGQASDISYNNGQSGMTATDVQEAIDELKSDLGNIELTADNVEYDNTTSGLQATNVQGAVDEITDNLTASNDTPFRFGYDSDTGVYGYIINEGGADTLHPFSSSYVYEFYKYIDTNNSSVTKNVSLKKGNYVIMVHSACNDSGDNVPTIVANDTYTADTGNVFNSDRDAVFRVMLLKTATEKEISITISNTTNASSKGIKIYKISDKIQFTNANFSNTLLRYNSGYTVSVNTQSNKYYFAILYGRNQNSFYWGSPLNPSIIFTGDIDKILVNPITEIINSNTNDVWTLSLIQGDGSSAIYAMSAYSYATGHGNMSAGGTILTLD